jgi:hypothetical protein
MQLRAGWLATLLLPAFVARAQAGLDCNTAKLADPANATYVIEGDAVTLVRGMRRQAAAPGAHTMHETRLIPGAQACGNFDGEPVVVTLLSDDPGGCGSYVYVAALPRSGRSYPAALIGDRIVPKSVVVDKGQIVVTYLGRSNDAPMAAPPTQKLVRRFGLQHGHLLDQP